MIDNHLDCVGTGVVCLERDTGLHEMRGKTATFWGKGESGDKMSSTERTIEH